MSAVLNEQTIELQAQEVQHHPAPAVQQRALAPQQTEQSAILTVIARAASDPAVDVEKMERLLAMQERVLSRNAESAFNEAMRLAQSELGQVSTDAQNLQTKSKYATYAALDAAARPVYTRHGFSVSYDTGDGAPEGYMRVLAYVSHSAGHTRTYRADIPSDGKGAKGGDVMTKTHAFGAGASYGQRYLLKLIFNIAIGEYDNDGNTAEVSSDQLLATAREMSLRGSAAFKAYLSMLTKAASAELEPEMESLKRAAEAADRPGYTSERFSENLPGWQKVVASGRKSPEDLIAFLESRATLTDEQRATIRNLKGEQ